MAVTQAKQIRVREPRDWWSTGADGSVGATHGSPIRLPTDQSATIPKDWAPHIFVNSFECPINRVKADLVASHWCVGDQIALDEMYEGSWLGEPCQLSISDNAVLVFYTMHESVWQRSGGTFCISGFELDDEPVTESEVDWPIARRIEDIESRLNLTRSQIAQALRVERATMYQWFRGSQPRSPKTLKRIQNLQQFAVDWSEAGLGPARSYWYFKAPNSHCTIGDILTRYELSESELRSLVSQLRESPDSVEAVKRSGVYGYPPESKSEELRRRSSTFPSTFSES